MKTNFIITQLGLLIGNLISYMIFEITIKDIVLAQLCVTFGYLLAIWHYKDVLGKEKPE